MGSGRERLIVFGGSPSGSSASTSSAWELSPGGEVWRWTQIPDPQQPAARAGHVSVWDEQREQLLVWGGEDGDEHRRSIGDELWALAWDGASWSWRVLPTAGTPPPRRGYARSTWIADERKILLFGGGVNFDSWTLSETDEGWKWEFIEAPSAVAPTWAIGSGWGGAAGAVWDPEGKQLLLCGRAWGKSDPKMAVWALGRVGDVWAWTEQPTSGGPEVPFFKHLAAWDSNGHRAIIVARTDGVPGVSTWSLARQGEGWVWSELVPPATDWHLRDRASAAWDQGGQQMLVFGVDVGASPASSSTLMRSLANIDGAWVWSEPVVVGAPPALRDGHRSEWDAANRRVVLYGGFGVHSYQSDAWLLVEAGDTWEWGSIRGWCETAPPNLLPDVPSEAGDGASCGQRLSWTDLGTRSGYTYVVEVDGQPAKRLQAYVGGPTEVSVEAEPGDHSWTVHTEGCPGTVSASLQGTFTVPEPAPPAVPVLVPQHSETCSMESAARTFEWSTAPDARYTLVVNGRTLAEGLAAGQHAMPPGTAYLPDNTWHVVATNCGGESASTEGFFTVASSVPVVPPVAAGPPEGAVVGCDPTLTWTYAADSAGIRFDVLGPDGLVLAHDVAAGSWTPSHGAYLSNGPWSLRVRARNCAGETADSPPLSFSVDGTPPIPVLSLPFVGGVPQTGKLVPQVTNRWPRFTWTTSGPPVAGTTYEVQVDGSALGGSAELTEQTWQVPKALTLSALTEYEGPLGTPHSVRVLARGCAGVSSASESMGFVVDGLAPARPQPVTPKVGTWYADTQVQPVVSWSGATDWGGAGVDYFRVILDGVDYAIVPGKLIGTTTITTPLTLGAHILEVIAVDRVGNASTPNPKEPWIFGIDVDPPEPFDLHSPQSGAVTQKPSPFFAHHTPVDVSSGIWSCEIFVDGVARTYGCALTAGPVLTLQHKGVLTDGPHEWYVVAYDRAGNARQSTQTWTVVVDTLPPASVALLGVQPLGAAGWVTDSWPSFAFTADDGPLGSGVVSYRLHIDGLAEPGPGIPSGAGDCAPATCGTTATALQQGTHTWFVEAVDAAGLATTSAPATFTVDSVPPTPFAHTSPPSGAASYGGKPTFCWAPAADSGSGVLGYDLLLRTAGGAVQTVEIPPGPDVAPICYEFTTTLAPGSYDWLVRAYDGAGHVTAANAGSAWQFTVTADTTPPTASLNATGGSSDAFGCEPATFSGIAVDSGATPDTVVESGVAQVEVLLTPGLVAGWLPANLGGSPLDAARSWSYVSPALPTGAYTFQVRATDLAGNVSPPTPAHAFFVDCAPPTPAQLLTPSDGACLPEAPPTLTFEPCAAGGLPIAAAALWLDGALALADMPPTAASAPTPEITAGAHAWTIVCADEIGQTASSATLGFTLDLEPPVVDAVAVEPAGAPSELVARVTASDAGPCGLAGVSLAPPGGDWVPATLDGAHWAVSLGVVGAGLHEFSVRATDVAGHDSLPLTLTVKVGPCAIAGLCDLDQMTCSGPAVDGLECDDGDPCTSGDTCSDGACAGAAASCDDGESCTTDACDTDLGCLHTPVPGCCVGSADCALGMVCVAGACVSAHCQPCASQADCGAQAKCTALVSGDYCLAECTAGPCPAGASCSADSGDVCVPAQGDCQCAPAAGAMCLGGHWTETDSCGTPGATLEVCHWGCAEAVGCCPEGTAPVDGQCVTAGEPDAGPDGEASDAGEDGEELDAGVQPEGDEAASGDPASDGADQADGDLDSSAEATEDSAGPSPSPDELEPGPEPAADVPAPDAPGPELAPDVTTPDAPGPESAPDLPAPDAPEGGPVVDGSGPPDAAATDDHTDADHTTDGELFAAAPDSANGSEPASKGDGCAGADAARSSWLAALLVALWSRRRRPSLETTRQSRASRA
jgi:hypothetical protein